MYLTIMQLLVQLRGIQSNFSVKKHVKLMWDKADPNLYRSVLERQLSQIILPADSLLCVGDACCSHDLLIDNYDQNIVNCLSNASKQSVPSQKVGFQKFWCNEELDDLKVAVATSAWRCAGCPRSGPVNEHRLECKYEY